MSLVCPTLLDMKDFGYWQIFLFYSSFVGFFHFGINDGIYLRYGGKELQHTNLAVIKAQFIILFCFQLIISFCLLVYEFVSVKSDNVSIIFFVIVYMIVSNLTSFFTSLLQAFNKLYIYSNVTIVTSFSLVFLLLLLFAVNKFTLINLMISYVLCSFIGFLYILYKFKEILSAKINWRKTWLYFSQFRLNTIVGFFLMISTISSMLIMGIGRFAIERKWGVITFGIVSLSFTITSFMLFFIRQIGIMIFPLLKRVNNELQRKYYSLSIGVLNIILLGSLLFVPVMRFVLLNWLPKYSQSLAFFILIIPTVIYEGKMQIILNTYMKAQRNEKTMMYINLLSLLISAIFTGIGFFLNEINIIILSITFAIIIKGIILEYFLNKKMLFSDHKSIITVFIMICTFIFLFNFIEIKLAWLLYLISYIVFVCIGNNFKIKDLKKEIKQYLN